MRIVFLVLIMFLNEGYAMDQDKTFEITKKPLRLVLFKVRGGDYAHPGDEEAVKMVLEDLQTKYNLTTTASLLDIGCGYGGTLDFFKHQGYSHLQGIDIDGTAIQHARQHHKDIHFKTGDAFQVSQVFPNQTFSLMTFFSAIYAMENKEKVLSEINKISHTGSLLALFDYTMTPEGNSSEIIDFSGKKMFPLHPVQIQNSLDHHGWTVLEAKDVSNEFINWYQVFLDRLETNKSVIIEEFGNESYTSVHQTFSHLLKQMKNKQMGGMILYAQKR